MMEALRGQALQGREGQRAVGGEGRMEGGKYNERMVNDNTGGRETEETEERVEGRKNRKRMKMIRI